jgi:hypothetical protein
MMRMVRVMMMVVVMGMMVAVMRAIPVRRVRPTDTCEQRNPEDNCEYSAHDSSFTLS